MIRVYGEARFALDFVIDLDMTEEEWDSLSWREQNQIIDDNLNMEDFQNLVLDDADVFDLQEVNEE